MGNKHLSFQERLELSKLKRKEKLRLKPPHRLMAHQIDELRYFPGAKVRVGRWTVGFIEAGKQYPGPEGMRLVLRADSFFVTYMVDYLVYEQSTTDFTEDITWEALSGPGRRAMPTVRFVEGVIEFMIGIATVGTGTAGMLAGIGAGGMNFYANNRDNFEKWSRFLSAFGKAEKMLWKYSWTLCIKVNAAIGMKASEAFVGAAVTLIAFKPARYLGKLVGRIGTAKAASVFASLKSVLKLLAKLSWDIALEASSNLPGYARAKADEYKAISQKILTAFQDIEVEISDKEAQTIVEDVKKNAAKLKEILKELHTTLSQERRKD